MNKHIENTLQALEVEVNEENGMILKEFINEALNGVIHQPLYMGKLETNIMYDLNLMSTACYDSLIRGRNSSDYQTFFNDVIGRTRKRPIVECRAMMIGKLKQKYGMTLRELGLIFGSRDHSSIIHSLQNLPMYCKFNKPLGELNNQIKL